MRKREDAGRGFGTVEVDDARETGRGNPEVRPVSRRIGRRSRLNEEAEINRGVRCQRSGKSRLERHIRRVLGTAKLKILLRPKERGRVDRRDVAGVGDQRVRHQRHCQRSGCV